MTEKQLFEFTETHTIQEPCPACADVWPRRDSVCAFCGGSGIVDTETAIRLVDEIDEAVDRALERDEAEFELKMDELQFRMFSWI